MTSSTPATAPFEGSAEAAELSARIGDFIHGELAAIVREHGINHERSPDRETLRRVWRRSNELGFYGITLPKAMGGLGLSVLDHVLIKEAIYASGSPLAPHVFGELSGPPRVGALARQATPYQLEAFIQPVANADKAICFALTEAEAGSDAGAVQTRAERQGDDYLLTGRKRFISGSPFADFALVMASTATDPAQREISAFFVDLGQPGARVESGYKTMAGQSHTGDIVLEACRVPARNMIGEPGRGLALALGRITVNRLLHCPAMVGLARVALNDALDYARGRRQFGRAIAQFQAVQHMLANMATDLAAARGLMIATARQIDAGGEARAEASMAKLFCSEAAFRIADSAVQIHGGEGIVQGRRVEFLFRMLRMYRVLTGTSEIQRNTIARELLGDPAA
ncbi:alkylation response protein AidB-like acyl-CoA dehydrogenase [Variovorax boronicumulans]|uniref:acyl-CoA dehydrogenase family protein n=1 Tax=Variovorax TaxID=34072 RepID=UPI0027826F97|nr:acyl-CoA dehydrogenase family protein [Variovorax boronicumulans]MDP9989760.1 alkylation response protein AidB-like acyl-CoA dehydrogenase [Variovorax boronicumulans]MDQ0005656.1 alkylation response protein AidB-like acyl-CoA dehydrogenase [Variovorax boronicumulans]MDQ0037841.1 alkylation response protein AidB-like acyl-CoA dehydrogenase [Variovorax boronicumulans]MDQ0045070.1 alkylation response protein AidB-like acyl-CoA dehydrogenase [Variovorax boronicumulans]